MPPLGALVGRWYNEPCPGENPVQEVSATLEPTEQEPVYTLTPIPPTETPTVTLAPLATPTVAPAPSYFVLDNGVSLTKAAQLLIFETKPV